MPQPLRLANAQVDADLAQATALLVDALRPWAFESIAPGTNRLFVRAADRVLRLDVSRSLRPRGLRIISKPLYPEGSTLERRCLLIPDSHWAPPRPHRNLDRFDVVLCKTLHETNWYNQLGYSATHVGFTSHDFLHACKERKREFFHFSQHTAAHATQSIVGAWKRHPGWPRLTLVQEPGTASIPSSVPNIDHRIARSGQATLVALQNLHLFHLCPSRREGFDPRLIEALCVGGIALTNQAELVLEWGAQDCAIVVPAHREQLSLAPTDWMEEAEIAYAVEQAMDLSCDEATRMSERARAAFQLRDAAFRVRLRQVVLGAGAH